MMSPLLPPRFERHEQPFWEHLEDLRRTLMLCIGSLVLGMAIALPLAPTILGWLKRPLAMGGYDPDQLLGVFQVAGGFTVAMRIMLWGGTVLAFPGIVAAVAGFVFPGLVPRERRIIGMALAVASALFAFGVALGYWVILPLTFGVMENANRWMGFSWKIIEVGDYISFVLKLLIAFGAAFELPVIIFVLGYLGIATSAWLRHCRRHAIVVLLIVGAVLTPPEPVTMMLMAGPLVALYEGCIWAVWLVERRRKRAADSPSQFDRN